MDQFSSVQILESFCDLIDDELLVLFLEDVLPNNSMQVHIHVLEDDIHILFIIRLEDSLHFDDVAVLELLEVADLSKRPLGVGCVLKCVEYFLQCHCLVGLFVAHFPHMSIGT